MSRIAVDFGSAGEDIAPQWAALVDRATPNVFLHPAALAAVQGTGLPRVHVLRAWLGDGHRQLIGVWALQQTLLTPVGPSMLAAPLHQHAYVANPVVDLAHLDAVVAALLEVIATDARLPGVLRLRCLDADCPSYGAIVGALAARGAHWSETSLRKRAFATRSSCRHTGATHDKLAQKLNRLRAVGTVELLDDHAPDRVREAFESFLSLEAGAGRGSAAPRC